MGFTQERKKTLAWIGLITFLLIGGYLFVWMLGVAALSASPNYPRERAVQILQILGGGLLFCLVTAIFLTVVLYKSYDQHWGKSLVQWVSSRGRKP
jgi:hypothetical protein